MAALGPNLEGVLEELNVPRGQPAVSLCCGDGYFTASLPSCLARPCTVYAMDLDAELTEHARRHVAERGEGELVAFAAEDATRLAPLVPEPVGFVLLANAFHDVPPNTRLACGVRKVLAPGRWGHVRCGQLVASVRRGDSGTMAVFVRPG